MEHIRKFAWLYAALFAVVVISGWIPAFKDADGRMFGLFHIDPIDDVIHGISGIWAAIAALRSAVAARFYFRGFGAIYSLDAVMGLLTGEGYLDGGIFLRGPAALDIGTRIFANLPHVVIGGGALLIGFWIASRQLRHAQPV
jgi:hypothetical protein